MASMPVTAPFGGKRRVGGVVGHVHHRQAPSRGVAAGHRADVKLIVGRERHRGMQTIGNRDRVGGVARHVADVHRIEGRARGKGSPGHVQGGPFQQAHTGAANRHGRRDGLRRDIELRHRGRAGGRIATFPATIEHVGGVVVGAEEGVHGPGKARDLDRGNRGGGQVDEENRV